MVAVKSSEAKELRQLAAQIEQVTRESRISSVAWSAVQTLVDYLTLQAKVMELEQRPREGGS